MCIRYTGVCNAVISEKQAHFLRFLCRVTSFWNQNHCPLLAIRKNASLGFKHWLYVSKAEAISISFYMPSTVLR